MKALYTMLDDLSLFSLQEPYLFGKYKSIEISGKMTGRSIATPHDAGILVQAVINAKHGDHVEIGTFYGHSAILVAAAKKEFGMHGKVYCVDPWHYRPEAVQDWGTKQMATDKIMMEITYLSGWCMLLSHQIFERIGDFDENLRPMYFEDADYSYRCTKAGVPLVSLDRDDWGIYHIEDERHKERRQYMIKHQAERKANRDYLRKKHGL